MPDPVTTIGLGAVAAYLSKDGIEKLLGPTAEYLGDGLRDFTKRRIENIGRIFQSAESKLGGKAEMEGSVPPRVLKTIVNDGSYMDDPIAIDYFGGILASSKSQAGRDDRGASIAKMIDDLSSYQLRFHYLYYGTIRHIFAGRNFLFNMDDRPKMGIFVPYDSFFQGMAFSETELGQWQALMRHTLFGLNDKSLIDKFKYGAPEHLTSLYPEVSTPGIICSPAPTGGELYLWAFGVGDKDLGHIFSDDLQVTIEGTPEKFANVQPITSDS